MALGLGGAQCQWARAGSAVASARGLVTARFQRGSLSLILVVEPVGGTGDVRIDHARLQAYLAIAATLQADHGIAPPRADGLLALRGVIESGERGVGDLAQTGPAFDAAVLATLAEALDGLARARAEEGARLAVVLGDLLDAILDLVGRARGRAAAQPGALKARMEQQLAELLGSVPALPPDRLAQEVAVLATRADVAEELARLQAHVDQARALLAGGTGAGRKLEFLAQEFNREANTMCSKSTDLELTRIGLDLKAQIDRLREQAANVE
jgi:uncharacterized protein (TIGR00255 family)